MPAPNGFLQHKIFRGDKKFSVLLRISKGIADAKIKKLKRLYENLNHCFDGHFSANGNCRSNGGKSACQRTTSGTPGEYIFLPDDLTVFGYILAVYNAATKITGFNQPNTLFAQNNGGGFGAIMARGSSITYYSYATDAEGNFVSNPAATWTLVNISGPPGTLTVAPDGKSAIYTAPNAAGSCFISITSPGLTTVLGGGQVTL